MKTTTLIGLILVSVLLAGCKSSSPKSSATATGSPAATHFRPEYSAKLEQICFSWGAGFAYTNRFDFRMPAEVAVVLPPPRPIAADTTPFAFGGRDMSLIDDTGSK
jgi:hypothetical protein